jgi:hypothetical protein
MGTQLNEPRIGKAAGADPVNPSRALAPQARRLLEGPVLTTLLRLAAPRSCRKAPFARWSDFHPAGTCLASQCCRCWGESVVSVRLICDTVIWEMLMDRCLASVNWSSFAGPPNHLIGGHYR